MKITIKFQYWNISSVRKNLAAPFEFLTAPRSAAAHSLKTTESLKTRAEGVRGVESPARPRETNAYGPLPSCRFTFV
jgi:hypothetical protein